MKKVITLFAAVVMIAGFSNTVLADGGATGQATSSATIVTPISIAKTVDMNFGNVAVSASTAGTVVLTPAGSRSVTGGITLPINVTGTVAAASFTIGGNLAYTYSITLPTTLTITSGTSNTMTVNAFTSTPSATGALSAAAGVQTLTVGATLNVTAAQAAGTYVSATPFDVTVNYN